MPEVVERLVRRQTSAMDGARTRALGSFPDEWQIARLGDLFEIQQGKALSPEAWANRSPRPFLRTANVLWGRVDLATVDKMDFTENEVRRLALLPGDLLVCEGGDIGRTAIWRGEIEPCCYQNHLHRLRARRPDVDPTFYMYWMQAGWLLLGVYGGQGNKTTIPNLSRSRLSQFEVPVPPLVEQRAIAQVLQTVQEVMEATEKVIAAARELKKSLMRHLFTYGPTPLGQTDQVPVKGTEIGPVPESWPVLRLEDVSELMQYGTSSRCDANSSTWPVLRIPNVVAGGVETTDLKFLDADEKEAERYRLVPGDILFVRTNGQRRYVGRCAVYKGQPSPSLFASYLIRVRINPQRVLPEFIQIYSETDGGRRFLSGRASGAADGKFNINTQILRGVLLPCPSLDIQREIVANVAAIDAKLAVEETRLTTLDNMFHSLLRHLMTGEVRVKDIGPRSSEGPL